jgi:hypothetical protein
VFVSHAETQRKRVAKRWNIRPGGVKNTNGRALVAGQQRVEHMIGSGMIMPELLLDGTCVRDNRSAI